MIGIAYKDLTAKELLNDISKRNIEVYGDPIGPTIDWYISQGYSWEEITEKSTGLAGTATNISYKNSPAIIKKILENFDAKVTNNIHDIDTIYCDLLIRKKFKVCFHFHEMVGLTIIALTKEAEKTAKEVADFIDKNF